MRGRIVLLLTASRFTRSTATPPCDQQKTEICVDLHVRPLHSGRRRSRPSADCSFAPLKRWPVAAD
jgi:hypothetical protein